MRTINLNDTVTQIGSAGKGTDIITHSWKRITDISAGHGAQSAYDLDYDM